VLDLPVTPDPPPLPELPRELLLCLDEDDIVGNVNLGLDDVVAVACGFLTEVSNLTTELSSPSGAGNIRRTTKESASKVSSLEASSMEFLEEECLGLVLRPSMLGMSVCIYVSLIDEASRFSHSIDREGSA